MLATNEKVNLGDLFISSCMDNLFRVCNSDCKLPAQHLYITSDEKIKEGDWCILFDSFNHIFSDHIQQYLPNKGHVLNDGLHKIIASTDSSLKLYGEPTINGNRTFKGLMPQPSKSFIEKYIEEYNEGHIINEVMVEYDTYEVWGGPTVTEDLLKVNSKDNTITTKKVKDSWNAYEMHLNMQYYMEYCEANGYITPMDWIENHKHF